jgi:G3E family GTPase
MASGRIPVQIITGFLGSGKTTLLNQVLQNSKFTGTAVIVNEFGEIGLDHLLVEHGDDTVIELSNGCLCCTVRGQLIETLEKVLDRNPDRILIETTGLADPVPVMQALIGASTLSGRLKFAGLYTVFDVINGHATLAAYREARQQLALADCIILSKIDLTSLEDQLANSVTADIRQQNPTAVIVCKNDFLENADMMAENIATLPVFHDTQSPDHHHHDINRHSDAVVCTQLVSETPMEADAFGMFVNLLLSAHGDRILRLKGLVGITGSAKPLLVQAVAGVMSEPIYLTDWPSGDHRSRIVVFLNGLSPEFVHKLFDGFMNIPRIGVADRAALTSNPLAIPGVSPRD